MNNSSNAHLMRLSIFLHLPTLLLSTLSPSPTSATLPTTVNVGVILDLTSPIGLAAQTAITLALSDFHTSYPDTTTRLLLHTRHSNDDISAAAAATELLLEHQVQVIIGRHTSPETTFLVKFGTKFHVPILSSATTPPFAATQSPYFVQTNPSESAQAEAVAALVTSFGWRHVTIIYEEEDNTSIDISLLNALANVEFVIDHISTAASDAEINVKLYRLTTLQTRVFILHATSAFAHRLLTLAGTAGMMTKGFAWITTAALTCAFSPHNPMITGVLVVKPFIPGSPELKDFRDRWRVQFMKDNPTANDEPELSYYGIWAYDSITAISIAAENVEMTNPVFDTNPTQNIYSTKLSAVGAARYGEKLLESILSSQFNGIGGEFRLNDRRRNVTTFEVVNVIGETERVVGYWTRRQGLTQQLNWGSKATKGGLRAVIWPGEEMEVPKGWVGQVPGWVNATFKYLYIFSMWIALLLIPTCCCFC